MTSFAGGLAQGLGAGLQLGGQMRDRKERRELTRHQMERQARLDDMGAQKHDLAMRTGNATLEHYGRQRKWEEQDRTQQQGRDALQQIAGFLQGGNTAMANQWLFQHPGAAEKLAGLSDGTEVMGLIEMGDGQYGLSVKRPDGAIGPWTENRGSYMEGDAPIVFSPQDLMRMANPAYQPEKPERTKLAYHDGVFFDPYSGSPVADHRQGLGLGSAGGGKTPSPDTPEARRIMDATRNRIDRVFSTHLGAEFIGDPENASLHAITSEVAADITQQLYLAGMPGINPDVIGAYAAEAALSGAAHGLRRSEAVRMVDEHIASLPRRDRRQVTQQQKDQMVARVQAQAKEGLYEAVASRAMGERGRQGLGAPGLGSLGRQDQPAPQQQPERAFTHPGTGEPVTMAEIESTARARGMTPEQVINALGLR